MLVLQSLTSLRFENRFLPCLEYPGKYLVVIPESLSQDWNQYWISPGATQMRYDFSCFKDAKLVAEGFLCYLDRMKRMFKRSEIKIAWAASDHDPRIGKEWFLTAKTLGSFNRQHKFIPSKD